MIGKLGETGALDKPANTRELYRIPEDRLADPQAWATAVLNVVNAAGRREIEPLEAKRYTELLTDRCEEQAGMTLREAGRERLDPILRLISIMESSEKELRQLIPAIRRIDDLRVSEALKKKWEDMIERVIALQDECREDPAKAWVYYGRSQEDDSVFRMEAFHIRLFDVWNDPEYPNSVIMAPPGHSKTTNLRGQATWEIGKNPSLRCLFLYDEDGKPPAEVQTLKRIMRSGRYHAIFPEVRVLERSDDAEDSNRRFTVSRKNWQSKQPTVEGASIRGSVNGNGYDRVYADDVCPPSVRHDAFLRRTLNETWTSVIEERLRDPANARIRMICTPWHEDDVAGVIARDVRAGRLQTWRLGIDEFAIRDDENGRAIPLWPERFTSAYLEDKKHRLGDMYTLNYRLTPRSRREQIIRKVHFYNADPASPLTTDNDRALLDVLNGPDCRRSLSIDPAASSGKQSSDQGVIEGCITSNGYAFVTETWLHHIGPVEMQDWIVERIMWAEGRCRPYQDVLIEAQGGIKGMVSLWVARISELLKERGCKCIPEFVTPGVRLYQGGQNPGKLARLRDASGYVENAMVRFYGVRLKNRKTGEQYFAAEQNSEMDMLRNNLLTFDGSNKADGIDAFTQWVLLKRDEIRNPFAADAPVPVAPPPVHALTALMNRQMDAIRKARETGTTDDEARIFSSRRYERNVA